MKAWDRNAATVEDRQLAEMIENPAEYFAKVREDAREEARTYVATLVSSARRARRATKSA
jgi:hypothetical protein